MSRKFESVKENVKKEYGRIALQSRCCGDSASMDIGYSPDQLASLPTGTDQGLGCGNPLGFSFIKEGDTVLDLGSGGGIDCFLAAAKTGPTGEVIGVDFTPQMIEKAERNAGKDAHENVRFILGDIEDLPVDDGTVDLVISNCVINLTEDKRKVFREINRVLKPGGSFVISDIVWTKEKPDWIDGRKDTAGCVTGAIEKSEYESAIADAGFASFDFLQETVFGPDVIESAAEGYLRTVGCCDSDADGYLESLRDSIASVTIKGTKQGGVE